MNTLRNTITILLLTAATSFVGNAKAGEKIITPLQAVKEFKKLTGLKTTGVKFYFSKSLKKYDKGTGRAIGVCQTTYHSDGDIKSLKIVFNKTWWMNKRKSNNQRIVVAWHEVAHCILRLDHKEGKETLFSDDYETVEECPSSIMSAVTWSKDEANRCLQPFKQLYIDRLFDQVREEEKEIHGNEGHEGHDH